MTIAIGNDHAGYALKVKLMEMLKDKYEFTDYGCYSAERYDYPDAAEAVANAIVAGKHERGILICGSGIGISIAANKVPGIRAAACQSHFAAKCSICTMMPIFSALENESLGREKQRKWSRFGWKASWKAAAIWDELKKFMQSKQSIASNCKTKENKEVCRMFM